MTNGRDFTPSVHVLGKDLAEPHEQAILVPVPPALHLGFNTVFQSNGVARPWLVIMDSTMVDWLSSSKSVQSSAVTIAVTDDDESDPARG
jgi:hypothetical protein